MKRVLILAGGKTPEHFPSLLNGAYVENQLSGFPDLKLMRINPADYDDPSVAIAACAPDVVFNAQIGGDGEDGTIQRVLDAMCIPYTHSGFAASNIGSDKAATKAAALRNGIRCLPTYFIGHRGVLLRHLRSITFPCVVKPVYGGSSIGVLVCRSANDLTAEALFKDGHDEDELVMVEKMADTSRNFTVAVFDGIAQAVAEHVTDRVFFDYTAKTDWFSCVTHAPANISIDMTEEIQRDAVTIHHALGCESITRSDFLIDDGKPRFLEINTQPVLDDRGLTVNAQGVVQYEPAEFIRAILDRASIKAKR